MQDRSEFVNAYTQVLTAAWSDEAFAARLESDPTAAVAEFGLTVPADARVVVDRAAAVGAEEPDVDKQISLWEQGEATGRYELHVPQAPEIDMAELSESELEAVSGGYCCCCPCCCS